MQNTQAPSKIQFTHTHTHTRACTRTHARAQTHTHTPLAQTHTHTHVHKHKPKHSYINRHTQVKGRTHKYRHAHTLWHIISPELRNGNKEIMTWIMHNKRRHVCGRLSQANTHDPDSPLASGGPAICWVVAAVLLCDLLSGVKGYGRPRGWIPRVWLITSDSFRSPGYFNTPARLFHQRLKGLDALFWESWGPEIGQVLKELFQIHITFIYLFLHWGKNLNCWGAKYGLSRWQGDPGCHPYEGMGFEVWTYMWLKIALCVDTGSWQRGEDVGGCQELVTGSNPRFL